MAEKKNESVRSDIERTMLDYLPIATAVAGGAIGRKLARKSAAKSWSQAFGKDMTVARKNAMRADVAGAGHSGMLLGTPAGAVAGGVISEETRKFRKR